MNTKRMIAAAAVVALAGVGGMFALAPELHGQSAGSSHRLKNGRHAFAIAAQDHGALLSFAGGGPRIGVRVRDVEASDVTRQKLAGQAGAVIEQVDSETPAAKAGLRAGDVVVAFDGERVRSARQLDRLVEETPPGRSVKMSIVRDTAKLDVDVTPEAPSFAGAMPRMRSHDGLDADSFSFKRDLDTGRTSEEILESLRNKKFDRFAVPSFEFDWDGGDFPAVWGGRGRLGVSAEAVSGQLATYFGVEAGVLVRQVDETGAAAKAGVKAGDVITAVNGKAVKDAGELRRAVLDATDDDAKTKEVTLNVTRDKKPITLKATIEDPQPQRPRVRRIV